MNDADEIQWESVIGLEIHCQLATESKLFSGASTAFGAEPNTQACDIDVALPGVLPVMNESAIAMAVKFGLSVDATINEFSVFARKNYFYPDLPKGYQISQYDLPIVSDGRVSITHDDRERVIGITRAHLEEDAGKSLHDVSADGSGIDLNRAGTPLIEIVSEPDLRSAAEAVAYLRKIHAIVRYLEICDGNMQEGSFRCDANVSIRKKGDKKLGTRSELKNINSFRFVEKAIEIEIERQIDILEDGGAVVQETRLYDSDKNETRSMRAKTDAHDYRYFPDPDLPPIVITREFIDKVEASLPELRETKSERFEQQYGLDQSTALALTADRGTADYFEKATKAANDDAKTTANWVVGELSSYLNRHDMTIEQSPVSPEKFGKLINRITDNTISGKIAKTVFETMWSDGLDPDDVIEQQDLKQITDSSALEKIVDTVLANSTDQVEQFKNGNEKVIGYLVGQVMKASQGKAEPKQVNDLLRSKLAS